MNERSLRPIVVLGLARSGVAAATFLATRGAAVVAVDRKSEAELNTEALALAGKGVRLETGPHREATFTAASLVVVSPGVPWDLPELRAARQAGVPVIAEIELAFRHLQGRLLAVTGTKGKSTTTAAAGNMLREAGFDARVGGNIGAPLVGLVEGSAEQSVFVVEVSSFQLEGIVRFHPQVAIWLNLSPDHLDRHATLADYAAAKARIFENQQPDDWAIVDADDAAVLDRARSGRARLLRVRVSGEPLDGEGAFLAGDRALLRLDGREEELFDPRSAVVPGAHLLGDLLFAAVAARLLGAPPEAIRRAVGAFQGVEHVLEKVASLDGVDYYNDSKATNVDAARRSLEAFDRRVLMIVGGRYKGGDFADLVAPLAARGGRAFAIGESRERIETAMQARVAVDPCDSLEEAVTRARAAARPGDVVLLAPACSSFDMFDDYADRGRAFKRAVHALRPGPSAGGAHG